MVVRAHVLGRVTELVGFFYGFERNEVKGMMGFSGDQPL